MTLGVFLALGESFTSLKHQGQESLMLEQNLKTYARAFDRVYVFTYAKEKVTLPRNCRLVTPPVRLHRYLYALLLPFIHRDLIKTIDTIRCFQLSGTIPAIISKIFFKKKFVFNLGYDYPEFARLEGKPAQAILLKILQPLALRLADHVIVKNRALLPRATRHAPRAKLTYLPNGVDTRRFKPGKENRRILKILFVGRLEPQKNLEVLIEAVSRLKSKPTLILVGDGAQRQRLAHIGQSLGVKLEFLGKVNHRDLPEVYRHATIFAMPSIKEGSPKALLEAMASGLACIASDIPEHREIIQAGTTGLLAEPTPQALAASLQRLITSASLRRTLGRRARNKIKTDFEIRKLMAHEVQILLGL